MEAILDRAVGFVTNLSTDQMVALFLLIIAILCAKTIVQHGLTIVFTVIGVLAGIYFLAPSLYQPACEFLLKIWDAIANTFKETMMDSVLSTLFR